MLVGQGVRSCQGPCWWVVSSRPTGPLNGSFFELSSITLVLTAFVGFEVPKNSESSPFLRKQPKQKGNPDGLFAFGHLPPHRFLPLLPTVSPESCCNLRAPTADCPDDTPLQCLEGWQTLTPITVAQICAVCADGRQHRGGGGLSGPLHTLGWVGR